MLPLNGPTIHLMCKKVVMTIYCSVKLYHVSIINLTRVGSIYLHIYIYIVTCLFFCTDELSGRGADVSGQEFYSRKLVNKLVQQLHVCNAHAQLYM